MADFCFKSSEMLQRNHSTLTNVAETLEMQNHALGLAAVSQVTSVLSSRFHTSLFFGRC